MLGIVLGPKDAGAMILNTDLRRTQPMVGVQRKIKMVTGHRGGGRGVQP